MVTLPDPLPKRLIVAGNMLQPEGSTLVVPETEIPKDPFLYVDHPDRSFFGRCPCNAVAWIKKFLKKVSPEQTLIIRVEPGPIYEYLKGTYPWQWIEEPMYNNAS